ncbi:unnamed protein product [Mycena citricolor]|uniref:Uncharacterized protein n=1 Tax=Mycena citricolor TaxID=2018698 RepID=A0AAD2H083_9AGAR|nr:unnamed protein product [Mycena citricolor]
MVWTLASKRGGREEQLKWSLAGSRDDPATGVEPSLEVQFRHVGISHQEYGSTSQPPLVLCVCPSRSRQDLHHNVIQNLHDFCQFCKIDGSIAQTTLDAG